ncbi:MAG: orotate phosphoribosyltransferase [Oscillospiraceae bacterium]|nr:orotate phosphoribosyltransferase [Oscillospiraceae bacterium]MBQ2382812.1 orotate phosphoribosyltransferase [Oscillospiraceae bacterium]MBQ5712547.1 orotate phosphoribosyltransferase [Oscillospiraceae bacterium]
MIDINLLPVQHGNVPLRFAHGHFATNHSHINYYIDITYPKTRLSEAKSVAKQLVLNFVNNTPVDTILCLDGTAVIGACLADELTKSGFRSINKHDTIYVVEPEYNSNSQMIFRENIQPMIRGKHVLILMASCTTGFTAGKGMEAIGYYGGEVVGVAALYRAVDELNGLPVRSVYSLADFPDYASYDFRDCPYCKAGVKIDALVNSYGYSSI